MAARSPRGRGRTTAAAPALEAVPDLPLGVVQPFDSRPKGLTDGGAPATRAWFNAGAMIDEAQGYPGLTLRESIADALERLYEAEEHAEERYKDGYEAGKDDAPDVDENEQDVDSLKKQLDKANERLDREREEAREAHSKLREREGRDWVVKSFVRSLREGLEKGLAVDIRETVKRAVADLRFQDDDDPRSPHDDCPFCPHAEPAEEAQEETEPE